MKSIANMKILLRLLGAGVLTTVAATSVVACGDEPTTGTVINAKVSQDLGLTDADGKGLIKATIDLTTKTAPVWKTALQNDDLATKLVTGTSGQVAGKDADSTTFLKDVLKLTADADKKFKFEDVKAIVVKVSAIKPTIGANKAKSDYIVTGGTYIIQFFKADGTTKLGDDYTFNFALNADTDGIINAAIPTLTIADFDIANSDISTFALGKDITNLLGKTTILTKTSPSDANTQMVKVMELLGKTAVFTVSQQSKSGDAGGQWAAGDNLLLKITTAEVTAGFSTEVKLTLAQ